MEGSLEAVTRGMAAEQKAVFERVWRRVMHSGAAEDVPLDDAVPCLPGPGPEPAVPALPACPQESRGDDFPRDPGVLGESCREYEGLLQGLIRNALTDGRAYQVLARRAGGGPGRTLAVLAAGERKRARELAAVYFLITGVRYGPEPEKSPPAGSYLGSLRQLFRREQETIAACLAGAELVPDPCLQALFLRHAREAWDRSCRVRSLVEQA